MEGLMAGGNLEDVSGDEERFLQAVHAACGDAAASAARELLDWSRDVGLRREFACKRGPQCLIKLRRPPDGITLVHIEEAGKKTWLGMAWLRDHPPFDQEDVQSELRTEIEGLPAGCYSFSRAGIHGQPRFYLSTLAATDRVKAFTEILERLVAWWRESHPDEP